MPDSQKTQSATMDDPRRKQLVVGLTILGLMILIVPAFYIVWRFVPGLLGEWLGVIAGVMSTPFLLEVFFIIVGIVIVMLLNQHRQNRDGDDFVYLEQVDDPDAPDDLPDHSKFAIYPNRPLTGVTPSRVDEIEGAIELGDHTQAGEWIGELSEAELHHPDVLALRLRLARETGKVELADSIAREIATRNP